MACSSSNMQGKGIAVAENQPQLELSLISLEGDVAVLSTIPISAVSPGNSSQYVAHSKRVLKRSRKLSESYVTFTLSEAEINYVKRMDEIIGGLPTGDKTSWIPMAERLTGWIIENRLRLDSSKKTTEPFFHHRHLSRVVRSKKHVVHFICYGSIPPPEKGKIKKLNAENEGQSKRKRRNEGKFLKAHKEFVEAFFADSYKNMMNRAPEKNDEALNALGV